MGRLAVLLAAVALPRLLVPGWSGEERLPLLRPGPGVVTVTPVAIDPRNLSRRRVGALTYLGGIVLNSPDPAFGGFSALAVAGDRFTLLSDGGNIVKFRMGADWQPRDIRFSSLPAGPRTGWEKRDRDAESLAHDPRSGRWWVGLESVNAIWRYSRAFTVAEGRVRPGAMRRWPSGGGPESLVRLADGRFVAISESPRKGRKTRDGLIWTDDPVVTPPSMRFGYRPTDGYDPSDLAELPDGRLVVLERAFGLPYHWYARVIVVARDALRGGRTIAGNTMARLAAPLQVDNFEGVAAGREGNATILWIVSDDNQSILQRTLLLKFRLDA